MQGIGTTEGQLITDILRNESEKETEEIIEILNDLSEEDKKISSSHVVEL